MLHQNIDWSSPIKPGHRAQSYAHLLGPIPSYDSSDSGLSSAIPSQDSMESEFTSSTSSSSSSSDHFTSSEEESGRSDAESDRSGSSTASREPYDPNFLDDPELRTGKHKTVIALPGYLVRIIVLLP